MMASWRVLWHFAQTRGSAIKRGGGGDNDASLHSAMFDSARVRGILCCYSAIDRVVEWVITFLVKSSLRVKAEQSQNKQSFCSFVLFSLPVPVQIRISQPNFVKKKTCRTKSNGPVSRWIFSCSFGQDRVGGRHQLPVFSWASSSERVAGGAFSVTFSRRTILPLSIGGEIQCIHLYPCSWTLPNFVQCSSSVVALYGQLLDNFCFFFLWFFCTVPWRGERCVLLQRYSSQSPVQWQYFRMYPRVSKLINTAVFVPVLNVRDAIGIPSSLPGFWPGRNKARPNVCLVRQIRSRGSTNMV